VALRDDRLVSGATDTEKIHLIRKVLAEPTPKWFQNAHRRANAYADQLRRIAAILDDGEQPQP
jgi:hypothetical protein